MQLFEAVHAVNEVKKEKKYSEFIVISANIERSSVFLTNAVHGNLQESDCYAAFLRGKCQKL